MSEPTTNNIYSAAVAQFVSNIKYEDVPSDGKIKIINP